MTKRRHISLKTRCASLIIQCGLVPYDDAKLMTDDQILSLTQVDHNILHETGHPDRDRAFNLTHMLIKAHREKTKTDAKIIAKGKRLQRKGHILHISRELRQLARDNPEMAIAEAFKAGCSDGGEEANKRWSDEANRPGGALQWRKLQSRGFDKTMRKRMDGKVEKR